VQEREEIVSNSRGKVSGGNGGGRRNPKDAGYLWEEIRILNKRRKQANSKISLSLKQNK
jgi:hypothetical protein